MSSLGPESALDLADMKIGEYGAELRKGRRRIAAKIRQERMSAETLNVGVPASSSDSNDRCTDGCRLRQRIYQTGTGMRRTPIVQRPLLQTTTPVSFCSYQPDSKQIPSPTWSTSPLQAPRAVCSPCSCPRHRHELTINCRRRQGNHRRPRRRQKARPSALLTQSASPPLNPSIKPTANTNLCRLGRAYG